MSDVQVQPTRRSLRGLDWLNFFMADVQTGVGPFVAVYLTARHWDQESIGVALTAGALAGVLSQAPAGAIVDAARSKRLLLAVVTLVIAGGALIFVLAPSFGPIMAAQTLHGVAGAAVGPAIAAISLGLVGHACLGKQIGRNNRFNSAGNVIAAATMGAAGYFLSTVSIFYITAALAIPTLLSLLAIRGSEIDYERARGGTVDDHADAAGRRERLFDLARHRPLLIFAGCAVMFHFANAAMLPLLGMMLAHGKAQDASLFLSAAIITTQIVITIIATPLGRAAERWGRKPVLLLGFGVLPIRGVLYTLTNDPFLLIAIQVLDGIGAGVFGVVSVLVVADVMRGTGRFNFAQGVLGMAVGIGASLSTAVAGYIVQNFGFAISFLSLAAIALGAVMALVLFMPETKRPDVDPQQGKRAPSALQGAAVR